MSIVSSYEEIPGTALYKLSKKENIVFQIIIECSLKPGYLVLVYVFKERCLPYLKSASITYICQIILFFRIMCFNVSSLSKKQLKCSYMTWTLLTHYLIYRKMPKSLGVLLTVQYGSIRSNC